MALGITAREVSLGALFAPGGAVSMPAYQRSYSWGEREASDLLADLLEAAETGEPHFVGAIVVVSEEAGKPAEIVDGQQRLTTLTILLACLRDLEPSSERADRIHALIGDPPKPLLEEEARWRLSLNHVDGPFFREVIQERGATQSPIPESETSLSQALLMRNAAVFIRKLRPMDAEQRWALFMTIRDRCALVRVMVDDRSAGFGVFRVLNTRGKKPSAHDIIKTDLFERAGLSPNEADRQSRLWAEFEGRLGGAAFDDLLRQIRFIYDRSPKGDLLTGFRKSVLSKVGPKAFLQEILPAYVSAYEEISHGMVDIGGNKDMVGALINRLRALDHQSWRGPALKFLVTYRTSPEMAGDPYNFFANLERLGYLLQLVIIDRVQRNRRYRRVMDAIDTGKWAHSRNPGTPFKDGVVRGPFMVGGPFTFTRDECRRLRERLHGRFSAFGQRRALALRLNASLDGGETLPPEADATVEHVLPRNPGAGSHWLKVWPIAKDRQDLCDTIGNFVLLPHAVNQEADRMTYYEKKRLYFNGHKAHFALTRDLEGEDLWTADTVRRRTRRLADILCHDWGIPET